MYDSRGLSGNLLVLLELAFSHKIPPVTSGPLARWEMHNMNSLVPGIGPDILVFLTCPSPTSFLGSVAGFRLLPGSISLYFRRHGCSARAEGFFRKKLLVLRAYPVIMEDRYSRFFRVCLGRQLRSRIRPEALRDFCSRPSFLLVWFIYSLILSTKPALEFRVRILPLRLVGVSSDRMSFTFAFRRCLDIPALFLD